MSSETFRQPNEVLDRLVTAGVELIRTRDAALAAALNVAPRSVELTHQALQTRSSESRGIAYRAARKFYRKLKDNQLLRPLLDRMRQEILSRS